uniref:Mediator complex subunit 6 n=1 Tax=Heterorhabditis bacteriophora TaxID=37862 RepID=A0A1I7WWV3_HETBA
MKDFQYFPRTARSANQAKNMDTPHSAEQMRDNLLRMVNNEYSYNRYPDWPNLAHINVDRFVQNNGQQLKKLLCDLK